MKKKIAAIAIIVILGWAIFKYIDYVRNRKMMEYKDEQLSTDNTSSAQDTAINSIEGNLTLGKISSKPNNVILTGHPSHRFVTIYRKNKLNSDDNTEVTSGSSYTEYDEEGNEYEIASHYVPGIQILYGYNLLNLMHYNMETESKSLFFDKPCLIKTVYYPSFTQDSINKIPVIRNYFLVSVYDEDSNKDKFINRKDIRHFYYFNIDANKKIALLPKNFSAFRSQYDKQNDVLYIFSKQDKNNNGQIEKTEPLNIFWIDLKNPIVAKRMY